MSRGVWGIILVFLMILLLPGCRGIDRLRVESPGLVPHTVALEENRTFSLRFIHSVEKTPVIENFFMREDGVLVLTSIQYRSQGVGLPFLAAEGRLTITNDGWFRLEDVKREFREIPLRVGPEAELVLLSETQEYPLYRWYPAGSLVMVRKDD